VDESRHLDVELRLDAVRQQVHAAAAASHRPYEAITLVVVTKTWPSSDTRILYDLGVRDVAENRQQDAEQKTRELADLRLAWHFIGQIQSNKAAKIAALSDVVHSVDSVKVANRLAGAAERRERPLDCFVQVNLDPDPARTRRGGVTGDGIDAVGDVIESAPGLRLLGVMGIAPLHGDARSAYRELAQVSARLRRRHPHAIAISAGMSADFSEAIEAGATHVRVGSAVLGERASLR
jgi:pyridoxal phosphate enzyme (YggS family)